MKNKTSILVILVLVTFTFVFGSCTHSPIIADIDGRKIRASDLIQEMQIEKEKYDPILLKSKTNAENLKRAVLENLIQEAILLNTAKSAGVTVTDNELKSALQNISDPAMLKNRAIGIDVWKEKQRRRLLINKLIKQEVSEKIPIPAEEIAAYYKSHKQDFFQPTQYHARQIIVDNKELATDISKRLAKGEDFATLAEEFSLSPDRKRGGDLGFFNSSSFPPIFTEMCDKLKIGEISDVVTTDYGYQIFQLIEKRPAHQLTMEEVKSAIETILREKELETAFEEWFKSLRAKARITVYEKILEDVNV